MVRDTRREPHPRENVSVLSYLSFIWTSKIFIRNEKEALTDNTLWKPYSKHSSHLVGGKLEKSWEKEIQKYKTSGKKPSLFIATIKAFWVELLALSIIHITLSLTDVFMRPYLLRYILKYFSPNSDISINEFFMSAVGMVLFLIFMKFVQTHYTFGSAALGLKLKTACISLIYKKSLRIPQGILRELSTGHVVNLVSNDASRFDSVVITGNYIWSTPIIAGVVGYQVYNEVGVSSIPGIFVIIFVTWLQVIGAKFTAKFRAKIAVKSGERIRLTEEILNGIQVIKMHAWEKQFFSILQKARKTELKDILGANLVKGLSMGFNLFTRRAATCFTLIVYVMLGERLDSALVYVLISYYGIISATLTTAFVKGIQEVAESRVAIRRLEEYLTVREIEVSSKESSMKNFENNNKFDVTKSNVALRACDVTASWTEGSSDHALQNVNLEIKKGYLTMVVGSVASGKSSLLNLIIGELTIVNGNITLNGVISYSSQEPWLFGGTVKENILMGLPFNKERYNQVIKACSLERDLDLFRNGDDEIVGERGASLSGGQRARINLARAVYKEADIYLFDDPLSAVDTHVAKNIFQDCFQDFLRNKTVIVATHQLQFLKQADHVILLQNGTIQDQGTYDDLIDAEHEYLISGYSAPPEVREEIDFREKLGFKWRSLQSISSYGDSISIVSVISEQEEETQINRDSQYEYHGSPYLHYLKIGNSCLLPFLFILFFVTAQGLANIADYLLNLWINYQESMEDSNSPSPEIANDYSANDYYISIYGAIIVTLFIAACSRGFIFYSNAQKCSKKLHEALSKSVLFTDISFFNNNPIGAILNRFARDMNAADEVLPKVFLESCQVFGQTVGTIVLTAVINYLLLIPFFILAIVSYFLRNFFMKTSLNLKRLEGACRSPIFTHLSTTLSGLSTIRAHGSLKTVNDQFNIHQDLHTSAVYSFQASHQGYTLLLDLLSIIYLGIVIFSFSVFNDNVNGADVGLAITQTVSATSMLQLGLRAASETTNLMTCVERILAFLSLKPEETEGEKLIPPPLWPSKGKIDFKNVVMQYKDGEPVLKKVNFTIKSGEKIGIVGRTGAGKSSITQAMFRFAAIDGDILIDDINTKDIPLSVLRSRIAIIPQDPILFSGDIRKNLDPYSDFPDYYLLRILDEIEVPDFLKEDGLDTKILDGGLNMSIGQRQLICLARAILRNSNIIILDEATANVDPNTDALIQTIIRKKFARCTVLTIAHRLNTVMDSDKIMVMDGGKLVEFDDPNVLLQKRRGYFYGLVRETGKEMAMDLIMQAQQNYLRKRQKSLEE